MAKWSQDELERALTVYRQGICGLNECSRRYGISKPTLKRHLENKNIVANDNVIHRGRLTTLGKDFEDSIAAYVLRMESLLFGVTTKDVRRLAFDLAQKHRIKHKFNAEAQMAGKKWYYGFMKRHPQISLRQPEATSMARARGFNKENVMGFFTLIEKLVDKHNIKPETIFNVDESGFSTVQKKPQKILAQKGKHQVGTISSGERGVNTTIVCCVSAAGVYIPPMIIFKRKRHTPELANGAPLGSLVEISETGYINSELFVKWLQHFISYIKPDQEHKILLLLDGHTTHSKNLEALQLAKESGIIMLQLPGHTTHRLQPLDVCFFKPLSSFFIQAAETWLRANRGRTISQFQMSQLLAEAYGKSATVAIAEKCFKSTGCWPVDRSVFGDDVFAASKYLLPQQVPIPNPDVSAIDDTVETPNTSIVVEDTIASPENLNFILPSTSKDLTPPQPVISKNYKGAQQAVELTSTPYKDQLEEAKENKAQKAAAKIKRALNDKSGQSKPKKKRKSVVLKKPELSTRDNLPSLQERREQRQRIAALRTTIIFSDNEDSSEDNSEDTWCLYCSEPYSRSKSREKWFQCMECKHWAHMECAGLTLNVKTYICELCS